MNGARRKLKLSPLSGIPASFYALFNRGFRFIWLHIPIEIVRLHRRPKWSGEDERFSYQSLYNDFDIKPEEVVLDVSCGGYPFPKATILADAYLCDIPHRAGSHIRDYRPFVQCDVQNLPFRDRSIDFVYCSHTLEHVESPLKACLEIMRVGKRGYIETPTFGKDVLFGWAGEAHHKWHVTAIDNMLIFLEYNQRQIEGCRSSAWKEMIASPYYSSVQEMFHNNQDIFNTMFMWHDSFCLFVFRLDGSIETNRRP